MPTTSGEAFNALCSSLTMQARPPVQFHFQNVQRPASHGTALAANKTAIQQNGRVRHYLSPYLESSDKASPLSETTLSSGKSTAITIKRRIIVVNICSNKQSMSHRFFANVFAILQNRGISADLVSTSEVHISMAINTSSPGVTTRIEDACPEFTKLGEVNVHTDMAIISLMVGPELKSRTGVAGRMFAILGDQGVNIEMISQGAGEVDIACVIPAKDAARAMSRLHAELLSHE